jgi:hypothetical protein
LDEEKSKHVGLAQQNGFGPEEKSKHVGLAQQNGFGLEEKSKHVGLAQQNGFGPVCCCLYKAQQKPNTCHRRVINMI